MQNKYFDAVVLAKTMLTDRIAEVLIGSTDGRPMPTAEAGSHVELRFGGAEGRFLRHYSLIGPLEPTRDTEPFWRIAVQREDRARGSAYLHANIVAGSHLRVSRPLNAFRLTRNRPHSLLIAGGIGITPIFAMARSLLLRNESFSVFYAGQNRAMMAYADELAAICSERLVIHETQASGIPDLSALLAGQPVGTAAYICGPGVMIEALVEAARGLGWDEDRIRFEVFNAAHKPEDEALEVRIKSGRTIKVGAGTTILDALETAGVETYSDCRRGECGLCSTPVLACDGAIDHRDHFFSDEERRDGRQMTICCSRVSGRVLELDI